MTTLPSPGFGATLPRTSRWTHEDLVDPAKSPRRADAWHRACALLFDGRWHPYGDVYAAMTHDPEPMVHRSVQNLLAVGVKAGWLESFGPRATGQRYLRLARNPHETWTPR